MKSLKLKYVFVVVCFAATTLLFSQSQVVIGYGSGGGSGDRGWSIVSTYDGGSAITGQAPAFGNGDPFLLKLDANNNTEWSKVVSANTGAGGLGRELVQTSDSGYVICGFTGVYMQDDILLARLSKKGDLVWGKAYRYGQWCRGCDVIQTTDKGFALANIWGVHFIKVDSLGTLQWARNVSGMDASSLIQSSDGGYVLAGWTNMYGAGYDDCFIMKYDSSGALVWARTFGGTDYERADEIIRTSDNGYLVVGWTRSFAPNPGLDNFFITKFDSLGNLLWAKSLGESYSGSNDAATGVYETNDSGFVVVGTTGNYGPGHALLVKFDAQNNYEWGYVIDANDVQSVAQTANMGCVTTGNAPNYGGDNLFLAKYDSDFVTCLGIPAIPAPLVEDVVCSVTVITPTVSSDLPTLVSTDFVTSDAPFAQTLVCMNDITPPVIESTTVWSDTTYSGPFEIRTKVTDTISGIDSVRLCYKRDEDADWVVSRMHANGHWYYDTIPEVGNNDDTVRYYIWANDYGEPANTATDPANAPASYYSFVAGYTGIAEYHKNQAQFTLMVNSPARTNAVFRLSCPEQSSVSLRAYDVTGRLIRVLLSGSYGPGSYDILFAPGAQGVYLYRLESEYGQPITGKIIIL